jgi:DTW domain-containing protein YfiP
MPLQPVIADASAIPARHAVARLRAERLAIAPPSAPIRGRGGKRCERCRLFLSHCVCAWRPQAVSHVGLCLLMADTEPLKPSNTGWLAADLIADTWAFSWSRTQVDPALLALLNDPQWAPHVVFPAEYAAPERVVSALPGAALESEGRRPLFVVLDGTWSEARKMFRKSPYLDRFPVLALQPDRVSNYRLRRSFCEHHFCTAEIIALCLAEAGETHAAELLSAWLDVFTEHYLSAKRALKLDGESEVHRRLQALSATPLA